METDTSLAPAGKPAADGVTPPAEQAAPTTIPTAEAAIAGNDIDAIRAHLRASDDVLVQRKTDQWTGLTEEEPGAEQTAGEATDPNTAATPGEKKTDDAAPEPTPEEKAQAEADAKAADEAKAKEDAEKAKGRKDRRVRYNRFPASDQPVIERMAQKEGLSFDEARAELIAEGVLPKPEPKPAEAKADKPAGAADPIADIEARIADLKAKRTDAQTAYDIAKVVEFQDQIDEAKDQLRDLREEAKAKAAKPAEKSQAQTDHETDVAEAEAEAIGMFADAAKPGSELYQEIENLYRLAPKSAFEDSDYPLIFATKAARNIGYKPAAPAAAKPTPQVIPKKPATVLPASGAATTAAPKTVSLETEMQEAEGNPEKLKLLLRKHGTTTLDE